MLATKKAVLLLNSQYMPIKVISLKKSSNLLFREKAEVIEIDNLGNYNIMDVENWLEYSADMIENWKEQNRTYFKSTHKTFGAPLAIKLNDFHKSPSNMKLTRRNIFIRDEYKCAYCGKKFHPNDLSIDHIIPKSKGGKNTWINLITACKKCNANKKDRTPKEAGMELKFQARKPSIYEEFKRFFLISSIDGYILDNWKNFFPEDFHEILKISS